MNDVDVFLRPGSRYFEQARFLPAEEQRFCFDRDPLPAGWTRSHPGRTPWTVLSGPEPLPEAGWKVHVAARLDDADETLTLAARVLLELGIPFKYMPARNILHMMERKYAPRSSSGKFITAYPGDAERTDALIRGLTPLLAYRPAAVPVADVPIPGTPMGARYGAFREHWIVDSSGLDVLAVRDPNGRLRPDIRNRRIAAPDGVAMPQTVVDALAEHERTAGERILPYTVTRALHRSNGGGVYDALTPQGRRVVLKEGRRHTGLGLDGRDAVASLADESRALRALAGVPGVPEHVADHNLSDRAYLVMEYREGARATEFLARHHPGMRGDAGSQAWADYAARVCRIIASLRQTVGRLHERGWSFGDLHPGNVLIGEDDSVSLIDFETASDDPAASSDRFTVAPGFRLPTMDAREADMRRVDLIHLWALCPDNAFWEFSDDVLAERVHSVRHLLPQDTVAALTATACAGFSRQRWGAVVTAPQGPDRDLLDRAGHTLADAVRAWMYDDDGPSPVDAGDVPWSLGGGMAGLLWVATPWLGADVDPALDRLTRVTLSSPRARPGLFTGRAGVALVLGELGRSEEAAAVLDRARADASGVTAPGLESGSAGLAWAALSAGRFEEAFDLTDRALRATEAGRAGRGLLEGPSGVALMGARLARLTGDDHWLDRARGALGLDLERLVPRADGTVLLDRGNLKHQPDLGYGSLGVALAAMHLHRLAPSAKLAGLVAAGGRTCLAALWATQGLWRGRTGALAFLAERGPDRTAREEELLVANLAGLRRYIVLADGRPHLPGHLHLRFSHSLGSGLAGAVRVLARLQDPALPLLPGLDSLTTATTSAGPRLSVVADTHDITIENEEEIAS
ncbi:class III lanthionine synthetase LanKC N-terminal domain-containing protein [Micrococcus luteus]|uniref:class III lanthionine synthetase LanKC N-terminal domain-containing protein n=1 Tax=Micrococcus luteus TaxID=1270 RepID=UPI000BF0279A|nr:phosphotransferase [Micrococcus luteus]PEH50995.1 hypothetical protein CRM77_06825 [Micrococcus luteus]